MVCVWGLTGHPRSPETLPFDRAHMTSFDFNRNYACILYRFRIIARFSSKVANFNLPHLHLSPPWGRWSRFQFRRQLWCLKTRVPGLSCGIICVILCLAVLILYPSVTDTHTQTNRQTDRHTTTAYTARGIASRGKNERVLKVTGSRVHFKSASI